MLGWATATWNHYITFHPCLLSTFVSLLHSRFYRSHATPLGFSFVNVIDHDQVHYYPPPQPSSLPPTSIPRVVLKKIVWPTKSLCFSRRLLRDQANSQNRAYTRGNVSGIRLFFFVGKLQMPQGSRCGRQIHTKPQLKPHRLPYTSWKCNTKFGD